MKKMDEMEMRVAYRATKYSRVFMVLALIGYCVFQYFFREQIPTIPLLIIFTQGLLSFFLRYVFMHRMTSSNTHEE